MSEESKLVEYKEGKLIIKKEFILDPNKDGEPLGKISMMAELDISEIPDEAMDAWLKKKEEKKA